MDFKAGLGSILKILLITSFLKIDNRPLLCCSSAWAFEPQYLAIFQEIQYYPWKVASGHK